MSCCDLRNQDKLPRNREEADLFFCSVTSLQKCETRTKSLPARRPRSRVHACGRGAGDEKRCVDERSTTTDNTLPGAVLVLLQAIRRFPVPWPERTGRERFACGRQTPGRRRLWRATLASDEPAPRRILDFDATCEENHHVRRPDPICREGDRPGDHRRRRVGRRDGVGRGPRPTR